MNSLNGLVPILLGQESIASTNSAHLHWQTRNWKHSRESESEIEMGVKVGIGTDARMRMSNGEGVNSADEVIEDVVRNRLNSCGHPV